MRLHRANERRGIILMVVLSLLTLFAIVGITFVLYADSEATSAAVARQAETAQRADMDPERALALFLGQFIYDANDDVTGVGSGLRGHSLARTMYGYNSAVPNIIPFSGVGRLHYPSAFGQDDYTLINYTWFSGDKFVRDPEHYSTRADLTKPQGFYAGGNAPYTYPDLNNFFLAAVKADGTVLAPSFHRPWLFNPGKRFNDLGNPSDPNNDWYNPAGKYKTLRPRPNEHPNFPVPDDERSDVKNLVWAPGGNDSIWIDIGAPVMTAPDGTPYKMLVAPLIIDLDGRINLNTAGNILGPNRRHVSNQGWGGWEVNLAKVLYADSASNPPRPEYVNLILGRPPAAGNTVYGRYGQNGTPSSPGASAPSGTPAHFYAQGDVNGLNETTPPYSTRPLPPGNAPNPATNPFASFQQGYLNGGAELKDHPLLYNVFRPAWYNGTDDRVFRPGDIEALLRPNMLANASPVDANASALVSDLVRLCPTNFGSSANPRFRGLVTPLSVDLGASGVSAYWYNGMPATSYLTANPKDQRLAPLAATSPPFPMPPSYSVTTNPNYPMAPPNPPPPSEFGPDWRAVSANPASYAASNPSLYLSPGGRIRLNRPLPPYPHMGSGATPPYQFQPPNNPSPYGTAYNLANPVILSQYTAAVNARQSLANDIYRRLLAIAGVAPSATPTNPTAKDLAPRRWLAQLAVNIVDYIDEDDIITPFKFYTTQDTNGLPITTPPPQVNGNDDPGANPENQFGTNNTGANPMFWVFGTELPKVVLNEALAEATDTNPTLAAKPTESVKLWIELFNTMQTPSPVNPATNTQPQDIYRVPLYISTGATTGYSPYRITIAQNTMLAGAPPLLPDTSANELGKANIVAPFPQSTTDKDFSAVVPLSQGGGATQTPFKVPVSGNIINAGVDPGNFFLIGPKTGVVPPYQNPFVFPGLPKNTPVLSTDNVTYKPTWVANPTQTPPDERSTGLTVMLRRLANPYLPLQANPTLPNYNPYVTIDYIQNVKIQSNTPAGPYASRGKRQPYAAFFVAGATPNVPNPAVSPVVDQIGAQKTNNVTSTFGNPNTPLPSSGHYDWLVHLDRLPISPMELLHVSAWQPYMLTQRFIVPQPGSTGDDNSPLNLFQHYAPWLDAPPAPIATLACPWWFDATLPAGGSHRLYRLFELLESGDRASGVNGLGRIPGRVNINTVWDREILQALIDANPSMGLPANAPNSPFNPTADVVDHIFANMIASRSPGNAPGPTGVKGATDRPFLPLSAGLNLAGSSQFPTLGTSVNTDTLLRMSPTNPLLLLFQNPGAPAAKPAAIPPDTSAVNPYLQTQLLTKLYNNVTTRSNTFAVFLTVGFFEVEGTVGSPPYTNVPPSPNLPRLGREIGRAEGRQVRHRIFAIIDRTNLAAFSTESNTAVAGPTVPSPTNPALPNNPFGNATIALFAMSPLIGVGTQLVIEPGTANEESVVVQAVNPMTKQVTANFLKQHPNPVVTSNPSRMYSVIIRGNPGPLPTRYDPRQDPLVVPYYSLID